eukprot:m.473268 g.473268  ORF g.473268 m.473268 type:complete len:105 (-) comp20387_c0_seq34:2141-2455(-)
MWLRVGRASDSVVGLVAGLLGYARDAGGLKQKTEQRNKEHDERLAAEAEAGTDPRGILGVDQKAVLLRAAWAGAFLLFFIGDPPAAAARPLAWSKRFQTCRCTT